MRSEVPMLDRRLHRSTKKVEALKLLLEAVRDRSAVSSIAVIDAKGAVVCGAGDARELQILGVVAEPVAHGEMFDACERLTEGTDVLSRRVDLGAGRDATYLAALGERVTRIHEAPGALAPILPPA